MHRGQSRLWLCLSSGFGRCLTAGEALETRRQVTAGSVLARMGVEHDAATERVRRRDLANHEPIPWRRNQFTLQPQLVEAASQPRGPRGGLPRAVMDLDAGAVVELKFVVLECELHVDQVGRTELRPRCREHIAALEATLMSYRDPSQPLPVREMLAVDESTLNARAGRLAEQIGPAASLSRATAKVGGGALPLLDLDGPVVSLPGGRAMADELRHADTPVIARISDDEVLLDPRTLADDEVQTVAEAVRAALARSR